MAEKGKSQGRRGKNPASASMPAENEATNGDSLGADDLRVDEPVDRIAAERHARIAEAAYYSAERRGFQGDRALDDWLAAERDIDSRASGKGVATVASLRNDPAQDAVATGEDSRRAGGELIEPDRLGNWARKLNVPAPRLREAIQRVGPLVSDVKHYLETANF